jgi:hypothetical protein
MKLPSTLILAASLLLVTSSGLVAQPSSSLATPDPTFRSALDNRLGESCGDIARAYGNGFGPTCTAALNDLNAFLNLVIQQNCLPNGVCGIGRLGVTQSCYFEPSLGSFAIWGFRDYQCYL